MKSKLLPCASSRCLLPMFLLGTLSLHAQATRTWVSGVGDDANPCSRTAPCKTWAGAISKTAAGGEIDALDPGGFGGVTITKEITLDGGNGVVASALVSGTNAIIINAGTSDIITLRNIQINGISAGLSGVRFLAGQALILDNVKINGFLNHCVDIAVGQSSTMNFAIRDTVLLNCAQSGVRAQNSQGYPIFGTMERVTVNRTGVGVTLDSNSHLFARDSNFSSGGTGILLQNTGVPGNPDAILEGNLITGNNGGIQVNAGSVRISNNTISANGVGLVFAGGSVVSFGNNVISGNYSSDGTPTSTVTLR